MFNDPPDEWRIPQSCALTGIVGHGDARSEGTKRKCLLRSGSMLTSTCRSTQNAMNSFTSPLRIVREEGEPLGVFFRPGKLDHTVLQQLLSEGKVGMLGAVFDFLHISFQEGLKAELLQRNLDAILDPMVMELATPVGFTAARQKALPWANTNMHALADFDLNRCHAVADQITQCVSENGFTAVLAPTHFLREGSKDAWFSVDKQLVTILRQRLDAAGCTKVSIYYPLAIHSRIFIDPASRIALKASLAALPIDALWLRIHPFGSESGDTTLRRYISACQDFHGLKRPLVAEKTGVLGLALLAFGAVAGLESGISSGDKFDFLRLNRINPVKSSFKKAARIYLSDLNLFLTRQQATEFFQHRGLRQFGCRDTACCRQGIDSMIGLNSRRHFAYTRMNEVSQLSRVTPSLRPDNYLDQILRPATDRIGRVLMNDQLSEGVADTLRNKRRRLDGWRDTLGELSRESVDSFSPPIERRIHRVKATA